MLIGASLLASLLTATLSLGGGIMMLSIMSLIFPPAVLIPLHGAVQLGSNAGRAALQRQFIQWKLVLWISLGAVLGTLIGVQFTTILPERIFQALIGLYIIVLIWLPRPDVRTRGPVESFIGGAVISFMGMIVGVTGPLVLTFIRAIGDRRELVATHATLMSFQNTAKLFAFTLFGFAFNAYIPLLLLMIVSGFIGTFIGTRVLHKLPETVFRQGFKFVITLMALDLLRRAFFG